MLLDTTLWHLTIKATAQRKKNCMESYTTVCPSNFLMGEPVMVVHPSYGQDTAVWVIQQERFKLQTVTGYFLASECCDQFLIETLKRADYCPIPYM